MVRSTEKVVPEREDGVDQIVDLASVAIGLHVHDNLGACSIQVRASERGVDGMQADE